MPPTGWQLDVRAKAPTNRKAHNKTHKDNTCRMKIEDLIRETTCLLRQIASLSEGKLVVEALCPWKKRQWIRILQLLNTCSSSSPGLYPGCHSSKCTTHCLFATEGATNLKSGYGLLGLPQKKITQHVRRSEKNLWNTTRIIEHHMRICVRSKPRVCYTMLHVVLAMTFMIFQLSKNFKRPPTGDQALMWWKKSALHFLQYP